MYGFTSSSSFTGRAYDEVSRCRPSVSRAKTLMAGQGTASKRDARRAILKSDKFNRMGFKETREEAEGMMTSAYTSNLVKELQQNSYVVQRGDVTLKLAKAHGFCWGVERAVAMAFETRKQFPTEKIWITNEIIHNPLVNDQLKEANVHFVPQNGMLKDLTGIDSNDVVILPAFGATLEEMQYLNNKGCQIVDTTCPWVSKVWQALDKHKRASCTSIIHGKWRHEETIATTSFAEKYIVVLNMDEAEFVAKYILNGGNKEEFLKKFENAMSEGFDPDVDLDAVGVANQTTMLKSETAAIGKLFERTMMKKFGPAALSQHFVAYDTICDATQERQDAMYELVRDESIDMMLVVGGFNSSNTSHLQEMAEHAGFASYWVDRPDCVGPGNKIKYRMSSGEEKIVENFLPNRPVTIGVTSGASTPDKVVEDTLDRICTIHNLQKVTAELA